jgi:phosphohistidine phosphatase
MPKTLWLLRHGEAEDQNSGGDFERRLTARGERQARAAGRALGRLEVDFEQVFTSPRVRAIETARLACAELGIEPVAHAALGGDFDQADAVELIAATGEDAALLLVGHEPDFSALVHSLTGARIALKKGGLAAIRLGISRGELAVLLRPREIELVAGG